MALATQTDRKTARHDSRRFGTSLLSLSKVFTQSFRQNAKSLNRKRHIWWPNRHVDSIHRCRTSESGEVQVSSYPLKCKMNAKNKFARTLHTAKGCFFSVASCDRTIRQTCSVIYSTFSMWISASAEHVMQDTMPLFRMQRARNKVRMKCQSS